MMKWPSPRRDLLGVRRGCYTSRMGTLAEIEAALPTLSAHELAELERAIREARRRQMNGSTMSAFDLPPLNLGRVLRPLGREDDLLGEMLDDARF